MTKQMDHTIIHMHTQVEATNQVVTMFTRKTSTIKILSTRPDTITLMMGTTATMRTTMVITDTLIRTNLTEAKPTMARTLTAQRRQTCVTQTVKVLVAAGIQMTGTMELLTMLGGLQTSGQAT